MAFLLHKQTRFARVWREDQYITDRQGIMKATMARVMQYISIRTKHGCLVFYNHGYLL